jgi:hypothetical protein
VYVNYRSGKWNLKTWWINSIFMICSKLKKD